MLVAHLYRMSTSAINALDCQSANPEPVVDPVICLKTQPQNGYGQWLTWLQSLLGASALRIYRCEYQRSALSLVCVSCFPIHESTPAATKLAQHCASTCSAVRTKGYDSDEHSLVCIPEVVVAEGKKCRHVLEIHRIAPSTIEPETQTYLVSWAFQSLQRFLFSDETPGASVSLISWTAEQIQSGVVSTALFSKLTNILLDVSSSERCMLVKLKLGNNRVKSAALLAISGQGQITNSRQSSLSNVVLHNLELALVDKVIPLKTICQTFAEPCMPAMSPLASTQKRCSRLIIPVEHEHQWYAISIERDADKPYSEGLCRSLSKDATEALLYALVSDPRSLGVLAALKRRVTNLRIVANKKRLQSIVFAMLAFIVCFLLIYPVEHRISAPLAVEASERHVLIAPSDGFVKSVAATAGDVVKQGEVLVSLDDQDLELEERRLESEYSTNRQYYAKALATHDRVDITRLKEEALHIRTQLEQVRTRMDRMVITAPVDGVVLSGSWDEFLGAAVTAGDTLYSLGSTDTNRLVLDVSEYDARSVRAGQAVGIRLAADPSRTLSAKTTSVMPLTMARAGTNSVQVHAALESRIQLRPGMQGVGKILSGRQSRAIQWLQRLYARVIWLGWKFGVLG